jgi:hypothetical protein
VVMQAGEVDFGQLQGRLSVPAWLVWIVQFSAKCQ